MPRGSTASFKPAPDPRWVVQAACAGYDTKFFFPDPSDFEGRREAIAICHRCPVQAQCLEHALEASEDHGIWGGKTERQRQDLRRRKPAKPIKSQPAGRRPKCACGCGLEVNWNKQTGEWYRYYGYGHHRRGQTTSNRPPKKERPLPTSVAVELLPLCACGCGQRVKAVTNGIPAQWVPGHHTRVRVTGCQ